MNAYDYSKQRWVNGTEGARLALAQTLEEIELLGNVDYRRFCGHSEVTAAEAIRKLKTFADVCRRENSVAA